MGSIDGLDRVLELAGSDEIDGAELLAAIEPLIDQAEARPMLRDSCLKAINKSHQEHRLRLTLAKLFYLDGMGEHCVRELLHLKRLVGANQALDRLLESFREYACSLPGVLFGEELSGAAAESDQEIAELDIDVDFDDALDDLGDD